MTKPVIKAWEQRDDESQPAFECFKIYRDLSINRTCKKVSEIRKCSVTVVYNYSSKHHWVERIRDYDRYMDRLFVRERVNAVVSMRRRQIRTMLSAQELVVDQINKHLAVAERSKQPVIPLQHLARLAAIAHADERVNMDVPDSVIRLESDGIDYDKLNADQLKDLRKLLQAAKKDKD